MAKTLKICGGCQNQVYQMDDQINCDGKLYHRPCCKCNDCGKQLGVLNFRKSSDFLNENFLLCKKHYDERFSQVQTKLKKGWVKSPDAKAIEIKVDSKKVNVSPPRKQPRILSTEDPNIAYRLMELLGEGSYGSVYKGLHSHTHEKVAVKIVPCGDPEEIDAIAMEIDLLKRLSCPYVVAYVESFLYENELWIIMEYCGGGCMSDLMTITGNHFDEECLRAVIAYCTLGLQHLHALRGIHRDIKAGNILLTQEGIAKIADFGVSVQLTSTIQKRKTITGTPYWIAPEVVQEVTYDSKADIWSLGITILELCEGHPPHFNAHPMRAIFLISMKPAPQLEHPEKWTGSMQEFLKKCLVKAPEGRSSADDLLVHNWISSDVTIAKQGKGMQCLRDMLEKHWQQVQASRNIRRKTLLMPSTSSDNKLENQELRKKVILASSSATTGKEKERRPSAVAPSSDAHDVPPPSIPSLPSRRGSHSSPNGEQYDESTFQVVNVDSASRLNLPARRGSRDRGIHSDELYDESTFQLVKENSSGRFVLPGDSGDVHEEDGDVDQDGTLEVTKTVSRQELSPGGYDDATIANGAVGKSSFNLNCVDLNDITLLEAITDFGDRKLHERVDPNLLYTRSAILGRGSYGVVYQASNIKRREEVAIKVLPCQDIKEIGSEIEFLRVLKSPYIVSFQQAFVFSRELWIVMEFCQCGSVSDIIRLGKTPLTEPELVGVVSSAVLALDYLHSLLGIHRDMKAGNILLTKNGKAKLADFGVSAQLTSAMQLRNTVIGTPYWMAPEVIEESQYDAKADIWSLGVTILEMCEGHPPHHDVHPMRAIFLIPKEPSPTCKTPSKWSTAMTNFLSGCLAKSPQDRPSSKALLEHAWIKDCVASVKANKANPALVDLALSVMDKINADAEIM